MSRFLTPLDMRLMADPGGMPLQNRDGRQLYRLLSRFGYQSDVVAQYRRDAGIVEPYPSLPGLVDVPAGYVTDLASIPQAMLSLFGEIAQEPAVPHDFAYSTGCMPRAVADAMLREACLLTGVPAWKAKLIYLGVRVGGGAHWPAPAAVTSIRPAKCLAAPMNSPQLGHSKQE